jgi:polyhydroxyalkanoate synthesis repressor PhaR
MILMRSYVLRYKIVQYACLLCKNKYVTLQQSKILTGKGFPPMAKTRRGKDEPTIIKKYANRRLYDTGRSSYVTLDDLREMMTEGYDFIVQDAKTGEDITRSVLTQIVAEKESQENGETLLPTNFLRQLVTMYGNNMPGVLPKYLESTMEIFVKNQDRMRDQLNKSMSNMGNMKGVFHVPGMPQMPNMATMPGMEELNRKNMEMLQQTMKMFTPFGKNQSNDAGKSSANRSEDKEEKMRELKQSIAEMQKELNRIAAE